MDLWIVGAAAAAGYIAKYWQNLSRDTGASNYEKPGTSSPLRRLNWRKKQTKDTSTDGGRASEGRFSEMYQLDNVSEAAVSTSGYGKKTGNLENNDDFNVLLMSSLPPGFSTNEKLKENGGGHGLSGDMGDNSGKPCAAEMDSFHDSRRNTSSLRTKRLNSHFLKPLSSLESCLMAQLYKEHARMEDYVLSALPSPSTTMRPLLVTDGSQIISKSTGDPSNVHVANGDNGLNKEENVCGIRPLPGIGTLDFPKKIKSKTGKGCNERLNSSYEIGGGQHFHSCNGIFSLVSSAIVAHYFLVKYGVTETSYYRHMGTSVQGLHDGMVLFCFGISIGIISSLLANRREVEKLKELLKQTENLVQDLQEELEMKDSLTVKELANENSQDTCVNSFHSTAQNLLFHLNVDGSTNNDGIESYKEKAEESSESMSKIEAELEAELERLGLNMNTCDLERRLSDRLELDPDFVANFAQGELRPDIVNGQHFSQRESNRDASGTSTTHSGNYAVSPRELSLRLHEVIQSRLEERVRELETALQNSQGKVQHMELEHKNVWEKLSGRVLGYSSGEESPSAKGDSHSMAQPLIMNLSGEAIDAYNEACEELMKTNESEEEDSLTGVYENNHQVGLHGLDQRMLWCQNGGANGTLPRFTHNKEEISKELYISRSKTLAKHGSIIQELLYSGASDDENTDCDNEMEKQLIKQIVEKTRKGSPAVLNAQRVLYYMDENEH